MDYKRIIKRRSTRTGILRFFSFIPDKTMLKLQYRIKLGKKLELDEPRRFTEKIQWYKLYYKEPLMVRCVDKYEVRSYIKDKGYEDILIPCYGVFDSANDIKWDSLPQRFVMKDTLGGGGNSVIIVEKKTDIEYLQQVAEKWVSRSIRHKNSGREWPYYSGKKPRIIIEKYLEPDRDSNCLNDYKFFCFNGKCEFLYVMGERDVGKSVKVSIFDRDFNCLRVKRSGDETYENVVKPDNYYVITD